MTETLISPEYREYLTAARSPKWGATAAQYSGDRIAGFLKEFPEIETILDYGCGCATLKDYVWDQGIEKEWTLYDPCVPEHSKHPDGKFDLVLTTDVLEHVEDAAMEAVLRDLAQLTGQYQFNEIACYKSGRQFPQGPYKGHDYHINLKAPDQWVDRIMAVYRDLGFDGFYHHVRVLEGWKVRLELIYKK
jgi:hypothetical protein